MLLCLCKQDPNPLHMSMCRHWGLQGEGACRARLQGAEVRVCCAVVPHEGGLLGLHIGAVRALRVLLQYGANYVLRTRRALTYHVIPGSVITALNGRFAATLHAVKDVIVAFRPFPCYNEPAGHGREPCVAGRHRNADATAVESASSCCMCKMPGARAPARPCPRCCCAGPRSGCPPAGRRSHAPPPGPGSPARPRHGQQLKCVQVQQAPSTGVNRS